MASRSSVPSLAFVSAATPKARVVRARLEKRYGAVKPAHADIIVALGGDGLMLRRRSTATCAAARPSTA